MINYSPIHGNGEKVPFAATWGARAEKVNREWAPIMDIKIWNKYFGNPKIDPGVYLPDFNSDKMVERLAQSQYGIDERIFSQLVYETDFLEHSYIIGMTWLVFLFYPEANPRQFTRYTDKGGVVYCTPHSGMHSARIHTYFPEVRCIIYYIAETYGSGWDTKLVDLFKIINKLQSNQGFGKKDKLLESLINMVPSAEHIWGFLFDTNIVKPYDGMTLKEAIEVFGTSPLNYKNMCSIVSSYFKGGELNYDRYIYDPDYKDIQPQQRIGNQRQDPNCPIRNFVNFISQ